MYMEKFVVEPRHIEIQIASDRRGKACHLSERDCSIQRRHQKLVEETPSPYMTDKLREAMGEAAIKAAEAVKYEGVGTVEFLVDAKRDFYFMEMNTRIQVEHTITEEVIDYDLIKEQIKLAAGEKISGRNHYPKLHSIQCRINAEDPDRNFAPSPGRITDYHAPGGHGVRVDTHAYAGYMIPPHYDSMISKLIVVAQTREEAIKKMQRALDEYIIEGVKTTIPFHSRLMKNARFRDGDFTTKFLEEEKRLNPHRWLNNAWQTSGVFHVRRMRSIISVELFPGTTGDHHNTSSTCTNFGAAYNVARMQRVLFKGIVIPSFHEDVWLQGFHHRQRGVFVKKQHCIDTTEGSQHGHSVRLMVQWSVGALAQSLDAGVAVHGHNQLVPLGSGRFQHRHMSYVKNVEHTIGQHHCGTFLSPSRHEGLDL